MVRPTVVLPQPDSPTMPSVSPFLTMKLTSSTALTWFTTRCNNPARTGKFLTRFFTSTRVSPLWLVFLSTFQYSKKGLMNFKPRELPFPFLIEPEKVLVVRLDFFKDKIHFATNRQ